MCVCVCGVWLREEGEISLCPFLSKFRLAGKKHWLSTFCLPGTAIFILCFILCPENSSWQPSVWGSSKYGQSEMWVAIHLQLVSYWLLSALKGIVLSLSYFWLSLGVVLVLGTVVYFVPSLWMPLVPMGLFNIARNIYCLSWLKPDKIFYFFIHFFLTRYFKRCFIQLCGQKLANWNLIFRAW